MCAGIVHHYLSDLSVRVPESVNFCLCTFLLHHCLRWVWLNVRVSGSPSPPPHCNSLPWSRSHTVQLSFTFLLCCGLLLLFFVGAFFTLLFFFSFGLVLFQFHCYYNTNNSTTLFPGVSTIALGMFHGARYTHHTFTRNHKTSLEMVLDHAYNHKYYQFYCYLLCLTPKASESLSSLS